MKIENIAWKREDAFFHPLNVFPVPNNLLGWRSIDGDATSRLICIHIQVRCHSIMIFCLYVFFITTEILNYIVTYRTIARQRLGKHILAGANARNNRKSIARQRFSKHT
jgi:hypothetical protein